jgi:hypothetical protein
LAWEAAAYSVNGNSIGSKSLCGKFAHVSIAGDVGPVLFNDIPWKLLNFTKCDGFKSASAFKAKAEASYPAKQIKNL